MPGAITIFTNTVFANCKNKWPDVVDCISRNGFKINNEDEGYGVWAAGILALDTLHAFQVLDNNIANSIYENVGYYFDYRIEKLKDWPPTLKEMYDFFCYIYFKNEEEYKKNPDPAKMPPVTTSLVVLLGIILGYKNITNTNSIPYNSPNTQKMLSEFFEIILSSIGTWGVINKQYKVNWFYQ